MVEPLPKGEYSKLISPMGPHYGSNSWTHAVKLLWGACHSTEPFCQFSSRYELVFSQIYVAIWRHLGTINSSPPSAAYMRQCIGSALVQIMSRCLFGVKPLCWVNVNWNLKNRLWRNFNTKFERFHLWKCVWKCRLRNGGHFVQGKMN